MTSPMRTTTSKHGDSVSGEIMGPRENLRGALLQETSSALLASSFDEVIAGGRAYPILSELRSVTD